jgi:hypothetical protein
MLNKSNASETPSSEAALLVHAIARLRASVMATTFGLAGGAGIFLATALLVIRGGDVVGPHLGLLNNYFPGYTVTWPGAFLGLGYGTIVGACTGWILAWVYNRIADRGTRA